LENHIMIFDVLNSFSATSNGAIVGDSPTATGSTASTNVIDLGVARDIGGGVTDELFLDCSVVAAFASGGSATLQVQLQGSNDNASWSTLEQSDAVPVAALAQGYKFLPGRLVSPQSTGLFRFLRLNYAIGTAAMTAGTLVAGLVPAMQKSPAYARGYAA
jgi:microcystin degradation protein MlrC